MRGPSNATLDMDDHPNQDKRQSFNSREADEELYVGDDGLIAVSPMDDKSLLDKFKAQLERREQELRQAAEYGLGLLEANEELQMQVATLKIQLETETEELSVERDMWQRRTEHALQETAQWKRKFARVEEEKVDLAEEFEQFVDRCQCRGPDTEVSSSCEPTPSTGRRYSHHLDTIAQLQTELQELQAAERSNEEELMSLRQWKELAEQQQQEALECEVLAAQSEVSYRKKMETERAATQRTMNELKNENGQLRKAIIRFEEEVKALKKQLRLAEEARDDTQVHSNELSEELLSSKSRCKRFQRELELLEHVSYFSQAIMDRDDEESDSDDEIVEEKDLQTVVACDEKSVVKNVGTTTSDNDTQDPAMPSPLRIRRRRSFLVATATPYSPFPTTTVAEDGTQVKVSESEMETHKKLHHYFHLTALSIINENNLLERCFSSSSRLTIDMWYREIVAKDIPFLKWHSWLINRISEVAASVQDADEVPHPPSSSSKGFGSAFLGFSLRKTSGSSDTEPQKNALPSPPMTSSPAASPVARVPLAVARAFFRLLRKRTTNETEPDSSPVGGSPVNRSPVG